MHTYLLKQAINPYVACVSETQVNVNIHFIQLAVELLFVSLSNFGHCICRHNTVFFDPNFMVIIITSEVSLFEFYFLWLCNITLHVLSSRLLNSYIIIIREL